MYVTLTVPLAWEIVAVVPEVDELNVMLLEVPPPAIKFVNVVVVDAGNITVIAFGTMLPNVLKVFAPVNVSVVDEPDNVKLLNVLLPPAKVTEAPVVDNKIVDVLGVTVKLVDVVKSQTVVAVAELFIVHVPVPSKAERVFELLDEKIGTVTLYVLALNVPAVKVSVPVDVKALPKVNV